MNDTLDPVWARASALFETEPVRRALGQDVQPRLLGRSLTLAAESCAVSCGLDVIPSETTPAERRFLFAFAAQLWRGRTVVEVGPFLGGTTRALALGMLRNPRRAANARLLTFDRFAHYHQPASLRRHLEPLVVRGVLPASLLSDIDAAASFGGVFRALHGSTPYAPLLDVVEAWLADDRVSEATLSHPFRLPRDRELDLVFVDGCKSWYATKAFLRELAPRVTPGAHLIFQDYGWYTCFWIPALLHELRDCFELIAHVDATYAFELVRPLDARRIEQQIPDTVDELGAAGLHKLFTELVDAASERSDLEARVFHQLQRVAALRASGDHPAAAQAMAALARDRWVGRPLALIEAARRTWGLH